MRCGTGAFQIRSCPRNCKRQARANPKPLGSPGKAVTGGEPRARRPAVDAVVGRAGCLGIGRSPSAPRDACRSGAGEFLRSTERDRSRGRGGDAPTIYVCVTCRPVGEPDSELRPGAVLAAAVERAAAGTEVTVRPMRCLANCSRGPSAALRCNGSWTYVFGGLDPAFAGALVEGARLLARAADGILPWRGRPEPLKRGLIARVPPIGFEEVDA